MIVSEQIAACCYGFAAGLLTGAGLMLCFRYRPKSIRQEMEALEAEIMKATQEQIDAMRTLTSFRREYHDGTGALVREAHKLGREVARLKTAVKERGIKSGKK